MSLPMMEYYYTILLLLLPVMLTISLIYSKPKSKLPPGPKPWPIIGNIHLLGKKPHLSVTNLAKTYGPCMTLKLGSVTTIVISSPALAKEMFLKHDLALSGRQIPNVVRAANHNQHSIIFLPVCPKWKHFRKIGTIHLFSNQSLDSSQGLRHKKVNEMVEFVKGCCEKGVAIGIGKAAFTTSLNLLSNTFFSIDLSSHDSSYSGEFKELIWGLSELSATPNLSDLFPLLKHLDLQGLKRKMEGYFSQLLGLFEEIINERLRSDPLGFKDDVLSALLRLVKEEELSLEDVKHVLIDLYAAGTETTSDTIEWAMTHLLRQPENMAKAQEEIDQVIGKNGFVQESDIVKLPYIQAIIKETLRLHPATPFLIPHKAVKEVKLCDNYVPKSTQIWVNIWSIGHDPTLWQNPESFAPDRFLGMEFDVKDQNFQFIPFGAGRRTCPGMSLAYRMVHLILATLLYHFNWKLPDGMSPNNLDLEEKFGLSLRKEHPLQITPIFRCF